LYHQLNVAIGNIPSRQRIYTAVFQKSDVTYIFFKLLSQNEPVFMLFGVKNREETSRQKIINLSTSRVKCNHCACEIQTSFI